MGGRPRRLSPPLYRYGEGVRRGSTCSACSAKVSGAFCASCGARQDRLDVDGVDWVAAPDSDAVVEQRPLPKRVLLGVMCVAVAFLLGVSANDDPRRSAATSTSTSSSTTRPSVATTTTLPPAYLVTESEGPLLGEPVGQSLWLQASFGSGDAGVYRLDLDSGKVRKVAGKQSVSGESPELISRVVNGEFVMVGWQGHVGVKRDGSIHRVARTEPGSPVASDDTGFLLFGGDQDGQVLTRLDWTGSVIDRLPLPVSVYPTRVRDGKVYFNGVDGAGFAMDLVTGQVNRNDLGFTLDVVGDTVLRPWCDDSADVGWCLTAVANGR